MFTIALNAPASQDLVINYAMSGKAIDGTDYTLSSNSGQVSIPSGQSSVTVTLTAIAQEKKAKTAIMTLQPGSGYSLGAASGSKGKKKAKVKAPSATVIISG